MGQLKVIGMQFSKVIQMTILAASVSVKCK